MGLVCQTQSKPDSSSQTYHLPVQPRPAALTHPHRRSRQSAGKTARRTDAAQLKWMYCLMLEQRRGLRPTPPPSMHLHGSHASQQEYTIQRASHADRTHQMCYVVGMRGLAASEQAMQHCGSYLIHSGTCKCAQRWLPSLHINHPCLAAGLETVSSYTHQRSS